MNEDNVQSPDEAVSDPRPPKTQRTVLATAGVGLVMLVIGILVGYFGRPLVTPQPLEAAPATEAAVVASSAASQANPSASNPSPQALMEAVVAQTRHFRGDPNAPITIIEFSDFQ